MSGGAPVEKAVVVLGIPRSGTTLLTALLDAHPRFFLFYEPWNAFRASPPGVPEDAADFLAAMAKRFQVPVPEEARVTGFKETTLQPASLEWTGRTLDALARSVPTRVVWILRDPVHCLFSKLDGARRWWGWPDARFSREALAQHLEQTQRAFRALASQTERHEGLLLRYEALAESPEAVLSELMAAVGERYDPRQLAFHEAGPQPRRVMGDVELARAPRPVSARPVEARAAESRDEAPAIAALWEEPRFEWLRRAWSRLRALPAVSPPPSLG